MQLVSRSADRLDRAVDTGDYQSFARALFGFEEALELWPGNQRAQVGRQEARWAYAACAVEKDDLDLAASIIQFDPTGLEDLAEQLEQRRQQRNNSQKAANRLKKEVQETIRKESAREWQNVHNENFADRSWQDRWEARGGHIAWHEGGLHMWNGKPQILMLNNEIAGDLRISFTARINSDLAGDVAGDISCFLCAAPSSDNNISLHENGYEFKYGAFNNTRNTIMKLGKVLWEEEDSPLEAGHDYHVIAQRIGTTLSWWVNDKLIISIEDTEGLTGDHHKRLGLVGWGSDYTYSDISVDRLGAPIKADLLEVAQDHLLRGHISTALHLFEDVCDAAIDPARRERARAGLERARELRALAARIPGFQRRIHNVWPEARVTLADYRLIVDINHRGITDLEPLAGMPVRRLSALANGIKDLSPLYGMPINDLNLSSNNIKRIDALAGLPIEHLSISLNDIRNLAPLSESPLKSLSAHDNRISDVKPLAHLPLIKIDLSANDIVDTAPLAISSLQELAINNNKCRSLPDFAHTDLNRCEAGNNTLTDLPRFPQSLKRLHVQNNALTSLENLSGHFLEYLDIRNNPITSLEPLFATPPQALLLSGCELSDDALVAAETAWRAQPESRHLAHQIAALRAWNNNDMQALKRLARPVGHRAAVFIDAPCSWSAARELAASRGGSLVCLTDPADQTDLENILPPQRSAWLGLRANERDGARWLNNAPRDWHAYHHSNDETRNGPTYVRDDGWHVGTDSDKQPLAFIFQFA